MKNQLWQAFNLLYRSPAFGHFWFGRLISLFGDAFTLIALPWFVLQVTGLGTATADILLTLQLPAILTSLVIGSLIDRFQPRTIMAIDNDVGTVYADGDNPVATQYPQGTVGQSIWSTLDAFLWLICQPFSPRKYSTSVS